MIRKGSLILAIVASTLSFSSFAQTQNQKKSDDYKKVFKTEFVEACMGEFNSEESAVSEKDFDTYCNCAADKLLDKLTKEQIESIDVFITENYDKAMEIIDQCLEDLKKKATL